jgi:hypothetical protein
MLEVPSAVPYAWALVLMALLFLGGAFANGVRFVRSGGGPGHAVGMAMFGVLTMIMGWVAWMALLGRPIP